MPGSNRYLVRAHAISHTGMVREKTEDSFFLADLSSQVRRETDGYLEFASERCGSLLAAVESN